ncbi:MAG TPA: MucR family transcriptional regulator [Streptosporangiaceae bacterium]|nr:MucR family transcriptional regulator [Streptosporangiaceae bacterium]
MSVEMLSPAGEPGRQAARKHDQALRTVLGVLDDGTAFYAPIGEVITDGTRVICHLCGRSLRSVTAHLRAHGWTKVAYCEAFGLERGESLEGPETRKRRSAAFNARLIFDPAVREGSAAGRELARTGVLTRAAVAAATGRPFPEQRRGKAAQALAAIPPEAIARTNSDGAACRRGQVAEAIARQAGYPDLGSLVLARIADGASLAVISREAGLHKDWLSRHLADLDPAAADAARQLRAGRMDARWVPVLSGLGFADVASYLRERHLMRHWSVNAIATEIGFSNHTVNAAFRRHGLAQVSHASKRRAARRRADRVAQDLGYPSVADYISRRRTHGWTWKAIAAESGQPESWLRRHAKEPRGPLVAAGRQVDG